MVFISDRELADYEEETVLASQAMDMGNSQEELLGKPLTTGGMWVSTIDGRGRCVRMHR